jgi:diguanylate cyclase (GGDEF)-like protein
MRASMKKLKTLPARVDPSETSELTELTSKEMALEAWTCRFENRAHSRELAARALELAPSGHVHGLALRAHAFNEYFESQYEAAVEGFMSALEIARESEDAILERDCLGLLGAVHQRLGDVNAAIEFTREAFQINLTLHDEPAIVHSLMNFGILHREIGEDREAVRLFEDALERARQLGDATRQVMVLINLGEALPRLNRAEEAVTLLREGLQLTERHHLEIHEPLLLSNLADALTALSRLDEALEVYAQTLEAVAEQDIPEGEVHCQLGMARINLRRAQPAAAVEDAVRALEAAERLRLYEQKSEAHELLSQAHKACGAYPEALHHLEQHHALERQRREELAERRLRAVNAQFEVRRARSEAEIERLRNVELALALARSEQLDAEKTELLRELQRQSRELEALAFKDSLTNLPNRRHLETNLQKEFLRSKSKSAALPVAIFDVDDFKRINDEFSHEIGDAVLVAVAGILTSGLRAFDLAARYGGEEFVLMLPRTSDEQALKVCERLRHAVESFHWSAIHPQLQVTISAGLHSDTGLDSPDRLLSAADAKLYQAKHLGKNRVQS